MLQRTLRASRSRFTSVSTPLRKIYETENELGDGAIDTFRRPARLRNGSHTFIPLGGEFGVLLALFLSLLFIFAISLSFTNANDALYFKNTLDNTARFDPGVVLIGEDVDTDVDEPAVGLRWTIAGCGEGFLLSGSPPLHGSSSCGVLAISVEVYIDGSKDAVVEFDPANIPREPVTNRLMLVQNLMQFDSKHVLDAHNARFYPFDTYSLTTTLRVESSNSSTDGFPLRIAATPIIMYTSSFISVSTSKQGGVLVEGDTFPVRHVEVRISRPGPARAYAMLLFGVNWLLAHCAFGVVVLAKKQRAPLTRELVLHEALKQLGILFGILLAMPKLRAMMPNAPGFDGVLIDTIGYFPQMSMAGLSLVLLLLLTASRVLDAPSRKLRTFDPPAFTFATPNTVQKLANLGEDGPSDPFSTYYNESWYDGTSSLEVPLSNLRRSSPSPLPRSNGRPPRMSRGGGC